MKKKTIIITNIHGMDVSRFSFLSGKWENQANLRYDPEFELLS